MKKLIKVKMLIEIEYNSIRIDLQMSDFESDSCHHHF